MHVPVTSAECNEDARLIFREVLEIFRCNFRATVLPMKLSELHESTNAMISLSFIRTGIATDFKQEGTAMRVFVDEYDTWPQSDKLLLLVLHYDKPFGNDRFVNICDIRHSQHSNLCVYALTHH